MTVQEPLSYLAESSRHLRSKHILHQFLFVIKIIQKFFTHRVEIGKRIKEKSWINQWRKIKCDAVQWHCRQHCALLAVADFQGVEVSWVLCWRLKFSFHHRSAINVQTFFFYRIPTIVHHHNHAGAAECMLFVESENSKNIGTESSSVDIIVWP